MSEDDIRTKVVYPWLAGCGFDPSEISIEFSFEIRLGRSAYRIDGKATPMPAATQLSSGTTARPRTDVLVRRGQRNLMIVEVKAPDETVDDEARDQGISYARLLPQIAPFVVVTNGQTSRVYDSITRQEITGTQIPSDHPGIRGGLNVSVDELAIRAEALESFVSLSAENLVAFCKMQLDYRMRRLRDDDPASGKKYIPSLYVDRPLPRVAIDEHLDSKRARAVAVFGRPQVGKTNFLCRFAEDRILAGKPVLFYPAISLNAGLLQEIAEDFGWLLADQSPITILASKLGQVLQRSGSRLTLIIDGWNEADLEVARQIDRECDRLCSQGTAIQVVVSFTHSAARRLLVHGGNPSFVADATGIGQHGFQIIETDPTAASRQVNWSSVVIDPYSHHEQTVAYQTLGAHFKVAVPASHNKTSDPYLLGVAMRHFAGRALPDSMDEPELLRTWIESRIARGTSNDIDARSALSALGRAMTVDGSPLVEQRAKESLGLAPLQPIPSSLCELALISRLTGGSERYVDFYNSRDRDYVIACWSLRWPERVRSGDNLWGEFAEVCRSRAGADSLAWFFRQRPHLAMLLDADGVLPVISDADLRRVFLSSVAQLSLSGNQDFNQHFEKWAKQCHEYGAKDPDLRCRVEWLKLMAGVTEEKDDLLAMIPSGDEQREFIRSLLEVMIEYDPHEGGLGQLVLDAFERLHADEAPDIVNEEDSPLSIILKEERTNSSLAIRLMANGCLGRLMPRSYLRELGAAIPGSVVPEDFLVGVGNAVSAITHMYWGDGYCTPYIEHLGYGEDHGHYDERAPSHYNDEARVLASISRFTNISDAKDELRELVETLRGLMPKVVPDEELFEEPRRDAPGQLYLFE
jgi:hypothetical protein